MNQSSSCPSSPRQGLRMNSSCASLSQIDSQLASTSSSTLHRSASTMSAIRPRSSPSGLFSYTGILNILIFYAVLKSTEKKKNHETKKRFAVGAAVRPWIAR